MLSSTRWASTNFVWSELTVETLASPKHGKIIFTKALLHVSNKRETWLLCFEWIFEWYEDDMVFCVFIVIILRGDGKKRHLDANQFRHCYSNFFRKWRSERYLITAMFKGSSAITKLIDNCIFKAGLSFYQFYILRTWINMRAKSFTKTYERR